VGTFSPFFKKEVQSWIFLKQSFSVQSVLKNLEDLIIDVPKAPSYVAYFIANSIVEEYFAVYQLQKLLEPIFETPSAASVVGAIFQSFLELDVVSFCCFEIIDHECNS
jgi:hypothetical protein